MKKVIPLISLIGIFILMSFIVSAFTINTFTTGSTTTNLTWTEAENKTLYVNVSSKATITSAKIDLKGYSSVFSINMNNTADSFGYKGAGATDTNYGTTTSLQVRRLKNAGSPLTARTYLKFNNTISSGYTITSATLKLYRNASDNIPTGANYSVYHVNGSGSWSETIITWNNQPCGTTFDNTANCNLTALNKTSIVNTAGIWDYFDVTGAFQKIVSESKDNVSFVIRDDSESELGTDVMTIYASRETLDISRRPILEVIPSLNYSTNITIDTGNDGSLDYTNYSIFNGSTTIDLNTTAMNNWISLNCLTGWCNLPIIFYSATSGILEYSNLEINWTYNYSIDYKNDVLETSTDIFILQFIGMPTNWNVTANLFYNSTEYATTKTTIGTSINFSTELQIPTIIANSTNISLYWNYTINTEKANTTIYNQTVYKLVLTDCTSLTTQGTYNFTIKNQSNNLALSGSSLDIAFDYVKATNSTKIYNYSFSKTNISSQQFCIYPTWATGIVNATLEYGSTGFSDHNYYLYNSTLNNVSNNITLYLSPGTTKVTFSVIDENDDDVEDCYIKIQKYNVGTNTYDLVQVIKTDTYGNAIGEIILNTEWYKYTLEKNGVTLLITSGMKQTLTTRTFRVNFRTDYLDNYDVRMGIISSLTFNNDTKNFAFTYSDPTNTIHRGCLKVVQMSAKDEVLINNTCSETAAATILVNIGSNVGTNTYRGVGYVHFDDKMTLQTLTKTFQEMFKQWGVSGLWYSFILIGSVTMLGLWNPVAAVGMFSLSFGLAAWPKFGLLQLGWEYLVALFILAGVVMWKVSKR